MFRKRAVIAAKQETTAGTAESLSGTDGAINCFNVRHAEVDFGMEERPQQGNFDMLPATVGPKLGTIEFETECVGSGASGTVNQILSDLICACGYTVSAGVFTPTSDPSVMTCVTIGDYTDGNRRILAGCTGTFTLTVRNGRKSMFKFNFTGKPAPETATALIAPTFPTVIPPRGLASLSINSVTTLRVAELVFDSGSQVKMLETLIADTNATGFAFGVTADRKTTATADPEATLLQGTNDWDTVITTPTEVAFSAVMGSASNNTITAAAVSSKAQLVGRAYGDRDGVMTDQHKWNFNRGLSLTFA
jgi:hypothetical protein